MQYQEEWAVCLRIFCGAVAQRALLQCYWWCNRCHQSMSAPERNAKQTTTLYQYIACCTSTPNCTAPLLFRPQKLVPTSHTACLSVPSVRVSDRALSRRLNKSVVELKSCRYGNNTEPIMRDNAFTLRDGGEWKSEPSHILRGDAVARHRSERHQAADCR